MSEPSPSGRLWNRLMTIGSYPTESASHAGRRRIVIGYILFSVPARLFFVIDAMSGGRTVVGITNLLAAAVPVIGLVVLARRPRWFVGIVQALLAAIVLENLVPTVLLGGILEADFTIAWIILAVIGALIALDRRAAFVWFWAVVVSMVLAALLPAWMEPVTEVEPTPLSALMATLIGLTVSSYAGMAYFVRQRVRFQQESDDLLHNILPDEIATRLKADQSMIADDFEAASVLFADVAGFTPMSAKMSPTWSASSDSTGTSSAFALESTPVRSLPASLAPTSSHTTFGVAWSTRQAGWSPMVYPGRSRSPTTPTTSFATNMSASVGAPSR